MNNGSRNVNLKDLIIVLFVLGSIFGGMYVVAAYSKPIGFTIIGTLFIFVFCYILFMRKEHAKAIAEAKEKHDRTTTGKFLKGLEYVTWILFGIIIFSYAIEYFFTNAS